MAFTAAKRRSPSLGVPTTGAHRQNFLAPVPRSRDSSSAPTAPTTPTPLRSPTATTQPQQRMEIDIAHPTPSSSTPLRSPTATTQPQQRMEIDIAHPTPSSSTPLRSPTATLPPQQRMDIDIARPTPALSAQERSMSQSIQVICRFRPAREQDPFEWYKAIEEQGAIQVNTPERALDFGFDRVFDSQATQADVYDSVRHVVLGLLDGFNGTLLAYGQTGSGKTHTMMRRPEFEMDTSQGNISGSHLPSVFPTSHTPRTGGIGVIPRAVEDLFAIVAEFQDTIEFTFKEG